MTIAEQPPIEAAKAAYAKHAWRDAFERFVEADRTSALAPEDLAAYADAAWWSGEPDVSLRVAERAYTAYLERGDRRAAAHVAVMLCDEAANKREFTVAAAWLARARRLLDGDGDSGVLAHVTIRHAEALASEGKTDEALDGAQRALEIAERTGDRDAQAMSVMLIGQLRLAKGEVREGMALVDEATMAAVSGDLSLRTTGIVYCMTISACRDIADYGRASDWTEAAHRWCERQSVSGFPGVCRVHRAEIMALRGGLAKAEQEARVACDELSRWQITPILAEGYYEIGHIRFRMGDLPAAEESFRQAYQLGHAAEPGLSLLRLAEGRAQAANDSLQRALEAAGSRTERARLLPAQVEAAIAAGDLPSARAAAGELEQLASSFATVAMRAASHAAFGALHLAEGDAASARRELHHALKGWQEVDAPYEAARTRLLLGRAARATGDEESARLELGAAKATFERIGARRDARIAAEALGGTETAVPDDARVTRTFLFTDIVNSTRLVAVIGDDAWGDLIRWHDDTLRSIVAEHEGEEIRHQGDGLVVSFASPDRALACAVAIQRRLADHRRAHGFAPAVRIGVHETVATPRGLDYAGVGVHEAARVGAAAAEGEILTTRATLERGGDAFAAGSPRRVELKGISESVEVVPVVWR